MKKLRTILAWVFLLAVAIVGGKLYIDSLPKPPEEITPSKSEPAADLTLELNPDQVKTLKVEPAVMSTFTDDIAAVGSIDYNQNKLVQVFTPYQGRILTALSNVGDPVVQGQVLFTIDSPDLLAAETALITAAGISNLQSKTLSRVKKMETFGGASQQAVDQSTSDQMSAEGTLKAARDAVRIFGKSQDEIDQIIAGRRADPNLVVASPITGTVTQRSAVPGLLVQPGVAPPPYTVADLSSMWMVANVPESDAPKLKVGQRVRARVTAYPEREFEGVVTVLGPAVDPATRRMMVRSEIADPGHALKAGMFADFAIHVGEDVDVVTVPAAAIVREGDGAQTLWVTQDGKAFTRRTVKIGREQNGLIEVTEGLKSGEKVVTRGGVFLSNKLTGGPPD